MAAWQHDYWIIPQSKLVEYYGEIPKTIPENDYDGFSWWADVPEPNPAEIEKILPRAESFSELVKIWGSDRGDRLSLYYSEDGLLRSVELRIDLRREYPAVREFVTTIVMFADLNRWCFCTENRVVLMPDYAVLANDMHISDTQHFIDTHPAAKFIDDL